MIKKKKNQANQNPKVPQLRCVHFLDKIFENNKYSFPLLLLYLRKGRTEVYQHIHTLVYVHKSSHNHYVRISLAKQHLKNISKARKAWDFDTFTKNTWKNCFQRSSPNFWAVFLLFSHYSRRRNKGISCWGEQLAPSLWPLLRALTGASSLPKDIDCSGEAIFRSSTSFQLCFMTWCLVGQFSACINSESSPNISRSVLYIYIMATVPCLLHHSLGSAFSVPCHCWLAHTQTTFGTKAAKCFHFIGPIMNTQTA